MKKPSFKNFFKSSKVVDKKKTKRNYILGGSIFTLIVLGVVVPIFAVNNSTAQRPALPGDAPLFNFINGRNSDQVTSTVDSVLNQGVLKEVKKQEEVFTKWSNAYSEFLYEQERKASENLANVFKVESGFSSKPSEFTNPLKKIDEIRASERKELDDAKRNIQLQQGPANWEAEWLKQLRENDKYGKKGNEEDALEFLVQKKIKNDAYRRFDPQILSSLNVDDLKKVASRDIMDIHDNTKVFIKKGQPLFPFAFDGTNLKQNVVFHSNDSTNKSARVYTTRSFINEHRNVENLAKRYLERFGKLYSVSTLTLPGKSNDAKPEERYVLSKADFTKLISYSAFNPDRQLGDATNNNTGVDLILNKAKNYKGVETLFSNISAETRRQADIDQHIINVASVNSSKNGRGFVGFGSLLDVSTKTSDLLSLTILGGIFKVAEIDATNIKNPLDTFIEKVKENFPGLLPDAAPNVSDVAKTNREISQKIQDMSKEEFDIKIKKIFEATFTTPKDFNGREILQKRMAYYKKATDTDKNEYWVVLDDKGLNIVKKHEVSTMDEFWNYLKNDLYHSLHSSSSTQRVGFDTPKLLKYFSNDTFAAQGTFSNAEFEKFYREKYSNLTVENFNSEKENARAHFLRNITNHDFSNQSKEVEKIRKFIESEKDKNTYVELNDENIFKLKYPNNDINTKQSEPEKTVDSMKSFFENILYPMFFDVFGSRRLKGDN
ncbi:unknown; predicted coding region [Mycoplasmopsis pulmonis]|uniref:Membrane protein P80 n=1 Tax=Mycoplasmopsis pulmonis (strain UAB CTIP) TaxID=272635 RepID=Q98RK2_MYCPU|nr:hypothetical protein [Mycoplasmopsis pulmonis]CAC13179.1 unknown; predicted coding region [Mycoplasmopsis pulmonis]VEU67799.1 Uncharacterised protein [Mycoplasmopsis pulmonis]